MEAEVIKERRCYAAGFEDEEGGHEPGNVGELEMDSPLEPLK